MLKNKTIEELVALFLLVLAVAIWGFALGYNAGKQHPICQPPVTTDVVQHEGYSTFKTVCANGVIK